MTAASRVPLNTINPMWARFDTVEVDGSNPPLVASSMMSHRDPTRLVTATLSVALFGDREGLEWATLPQVLVDRTD